MIWILRIVSLCWAANLVAELVFSGTPAEDLVGHGALVLVLAGVTHMLGSHGRAAREFHAWLVENERELVAGTARWNGQPIHTGTRVRVYETVVSLGILSMRFPSRYCVGDESTWATRLACTTSSLVAGWWGLPWGPLWTVRAVFRNLFGGSETHVAELMQLAREHGDASMRQREFDAWVREMKASPATPAS